MSCVFAEPARDGCNTAIRCTPRRVGVKIALDSARDSW